jgi:hypothetical protein
MMSCKPRIPKSTLIVHREFLTTDRAADLGCRHTLDREGWDAKGSRLADVMTRKTIKTKEIDIK